MLALLTATAPTPAAAQAGPADGQPTVVPVYQMARPFYDQAAVTLGIFQLLPSMSEAAIYDSNIFASGKHSISDAVNRTNEALSVGSQWTQQSLHALFFATQEIYAQHGSNNGYAWGAELSGRDDITGSASLQLDTSFIQQPLPRGTAEAGGGERRLVFNSSTLTPSYVQRLNRLENRLQLSLRDVAYVSERDVARSGTRYSYSDRVSYDLSPALDLFLQGIYTKQNWLIRPERRDFDITTLLAGLNFGMPNLIQAEFGAGVLYESFRDSAFRSLMVPVVSENIVWNILPLTSVIATVDRTIIGTETFCDARRRSCAGASGTPLPGGAPPGAGRNTLDTTVGEIGLQHEFWHDILGEMQFRYQRDHFDFNGLTDETYTLSTNGRFLINRYLEADFDYLIRSRTANRADDRTFNSGPFSEHVVSITLKATP